MTPSLPKIGSPQIKRPYKLRPLNPRKMLMEKLGGFKDIMKPSTRVGLPKP